MLRFSLQKIFANFVMAEVFRRRSDFVSVEWAHVDDRIGYEGILAVREAIELLKIYRPGLACWAEAHKTAVLLLHPKITRPVFNGGRVMLCGEHLCSQPALVWCQFLVRMLSYRRLAAKIPFLTTPKEIERCIKGAFRAELHFVRAVGGAPWAEEKLVKIIGDADGGSRNFCSPSSGQPPVS